MLPSSLTCEYQKRRKNNHLFLELISSPIWTFGENNSVYIIVQSVIHFVFIISLVTAHGAQEDQDHKWIREEKDYIHTKFSFPV